MNIKSKAFTLVELLIVVGIIATLTAIAVPNFIEAQTRAKVSRSKADLRSIATALETYRTDYNGYPIVGNLKYPGSWDLSVLYHQRLKVLTSPVSYLSTVPEDVFASPNDINLLGPEYCYAPGNLYHGGSAVYAGDAFRRTVYSVSGRGPDKEINAGGYCLAHPTAYQTQLAVRASYDPTNGTISGGDIVQLNCSRL